MGGDWEGIQIVGDVVSQFRHGGISHRRIDGSCSIADGAKCCRYVLPSRRLVAAGVSLRQSKKQKATKAKNIGTLVSGTLELLGRHVAQRTRLSCRVVRIWYRGLTGL